MALDLDQGVTLQLNFEQDQLAVYRSSSKVVQEVIDHGMILGRSEQEWSTRISQRVLRLEPDGTAHVVTLSEPVGEVPAAPPPGLQVRRQVMYARMDGQGNLIDSSGGSGASPYAFPGRPLRAGEAWEVTSEVQFPGMVEPASATTRYVLHGQEVVGGRDCVRIDLSASEVRFEILLPDGQERAKVLLETRGILHFDPAEGVLVRMETTTRAIPHIQTYTFDTTTVFIQELESLQALAG